MLRDISVTVREGAPVWPGDTPTSCRWMSSIRDGASVNVSAITTSPHAGTHADSPLHVRDGWAGSHELPLDVFCGEAVVISLPKADEVVSADELAALLPSGGIERVIVRTGRTVALGSFPETWATLSEQAARLLLSRGVRLLAVDAPSVDERESRTLPVHHMIFSGGAFVLENLDLRRVPDGKYELLAFPLRVMALDAAPVRAVLRDITG